MVVSAEKKKVEGGGTDEGRGSGLSRYSRHFEQNHYESREERKKGTQESWRSDQTLVEANKVIDRRKRPQDSVGGGASTTMSKDRAEKQKEERQGTGRELRETIR